MFDLKGKTVIITGGSSGIGKSISLCFAKAGAQVHVLDLHGDMANIEDESIRFYECNVTDQDLVHSTFGQIIGSGDLDILVNNAGIAHIGNAENTQAIDFDRVISVNVKGVYNCVRTAIPYMKSKGGVILNMASVSGMVAVKDRFAYSTSKGAVLAMTYSIAKDYVEYGIRCNAISPARVHTPFVDNFLSQNYPGQEKEMFEKLSATQPIGRMGTPDEIAALALYLCSDEASFITGSNYPIDGGFTTLNS